MSDDRGTNAVLALVQSLGMFAQICGDVLASMHSVFLFIVLSCACALLRSLTQCSLAGCLSSHISSSFSAGRGLQRVQPRIQQEDLESLCKGQLPSCAPVSFVNEVSELAPLCPL